MLLVSLHYLFCMFSRLYNLFRPVVLISPVVVGVSYKLLNPDPIQTPSEAPYKLQPKSLSISDNPNKHHITRIPKTICIVGAGRAGCVAAKVLAQQGYTVDVYEKNSSFGGKWLTQRNIGNGHLPAKHYSFSDYEMEIDQDSLPSFEDLYKYLEGYVDRFNLRNLLHFNSVVVDISPTANGLWKLRFANDTEKICDYLILAGKQENTNLPVEELKKFKGKYLHASRMSTELDSLENKHVVVVGEDKSAFDCALAAVKHNAKSVTHVRNQDLWVLPLKETLFGLPIEYVYNSRLAWLFLDRLNTQQNTYLSTLGKPFKALYWKIVESVLKDKLPEPLRSNQSLKEAVISGDFVVEDEYIQKVKNEEIISTRNFAVSAEDYQLNLINYSIDADVIIFANPQRADFVGYTAQEEGIWNYMHIIRPGAKNLAFLNAREGPLNGVNAELSAIWISEMLRGALALPSIEGMENENNLRNIYLPGHIPLKRFNFNYWSHFDEIDELLSSMNVRTFRKPTLWNNYTQPLQPQDYSLVSTHRI